MYNPHKYSPISTYIRDRSEAAPLQVRHNSYVYLADVTHTLALLPVAYLRIPLIKLIFGEDLLSRGEDFTVRKNGIGKVTLAIILVQALFLLLYIWADGAGTRPFWFNALRFGLSLAAGYAAAIIVIDALAPDSRK